MAKIIYNNIIPFPGYSCINLFGVLFIRKSHKKLITNNSNNYYIKRFFNHEEIHTAQMKELLYVFFYIIYFLEWIYRLLTPPMKTAYKDISFEQEAYKYERDLEYLNKREHFAQWKKK